ncbi:MAG: FkbM family methyltransferase [Rhodospirillaceae bacterium]
MNPKLQNALLRSYAGLHATGVLSTAPGRWAFSRAYNLYKAKFEAPSADGLKTLIAPGATVVDIGANVGFFTRRFARWVGADGMVLALEPEPRNFADLLDVLREDGTLARVRLFDVAAAEFTGAARLKLNLLHPGDHKLSADNSGLAVKTVRLDDLLAERKWPKIALVKIDVQGAEERVLDGAAQTLGRVRPAWFVEVDDDHLRAMGSSAAQLVRRFAAHGYGVHDVAAAGPGPALDFGEVIAALRPGVYRDLLFKPC